MRRIVLAALAALVLAGCEDTTGPGFTTFAVLEGPEEVERTVQTFPDWIVPLEWLCEAELRIVTEGDGWVALDRVDITVAARMGDQTVTRDPSQLVGHTVLPGGWTVALPVRAFGLPLATAPLDIRVTLHYWDSSGAAREAAHAFTCTGLSR